ncbi:helix-turn-helix transcriptional regulator [Methylobacterium platani]|uniref:helix-turn-helix domain-containing protein n=1 Tax=Methylobacterium platani TaxID=427683 RepID=UPI00247323AA|nr:helix-turn-helix transcriptional regulator [Methylobacterium platani]
MTAARKHHGCTQAKLAAVLGISQGHLSEMERGASSAAVTGRRDRLRWPTI